MAVLSAESELSSPPVPLREKENRVNNQFSLPFGALPEELTLASLHPDHWGDQKSWDIWRQLGTKKKGRGFQHQPCSNIQHAFLWLALQRIPVAFTNEDLNSPCGHFTLQHTFAMERQNFCPHKLHCWSSSTLVSYYIGTLSLGATEATVHMPTCNYGSCYQPWVPMWYEADATVVCISIANLNLSAHFQHCNTAPTFMHIHITSPKPYHNWLAQVPPTGLGGATENHNSPYTHCRPLIDLLHKGHVVTNFTDLNCLSQWDNIAPKTQSHCTIPHNSSLSIIYSPTDENFSLQKPAHEVSKLCLLQMCWHPCKATRIMKNQENDTTKGTQ